MIDASARDYKDALVEALKLFKCYRDTDVQDFLNNKAIDFEVRGWATTYLLLNGDDFDNGILNIEGYFSVTHKAVIFDEDVSGSTRNKLTGTKRAESQSFVLIGQLGKYMEKIDEETIVASELTSQELLDDAMSIISKSSDYIICRNIIIECKPIEKVQQIYRDYGFAELQFDGDLHTMYLKMAHNIEF